MVRRRPLVGRADRRAVERDRGDGGALVDLRLPLAGSPAHSHQVGPRPSAGGSTPARLCPVPRHVQLLRRMSSMGSGSIPNSAEDSMTRLVPPAQSWHSPTCAGALAFHGHRPSSVSSRRLAVRAMESPVAAAGRPPRCATGQARASEPGQPPRKRSTIGQMASGYRASRLSSPATHPSAISRSRTTDV